MAVRGRGVRSVLLLALLVLVLMVLARAAHATHTTLQLYADKENVEIANRSLEFVNIIREDLRRNNDDYVAAASLQELQPLLFPRGRSAAPPALTPAPPNLISVVRKSNKRVEQKRDQTKYQFDTRRNFNLTNTYNKTANLNSQNNTVFRSNSNSIKYHKKLRVDKLKRLVDKEKNKLRGTGRTTRATPPAAGTPGNAADSTTAVNVAPAERQGEGVQVTLETPAERARGQHAAHGRPRQRARPAPRGSPAPDELDMAPARGAHIQLLRFKGRLCQRSVLHVEGPVYDAQGHTVVPAYRPEFGRGRQFSVTRAPTYVLPHCCNCCKKSVLGCQ